MSKELLDSIDPEQVAVVYFYRDINATTTSPLQVSWDNGLTWGDIPAVVDKDGEAAFTLVFVGPGVDPAPAGGKVMTKSRTFGIVRHVDNPEITPYRFHVDVRPVSS